VEAEGVEADGVEADGVEADGVEADGSDTELFISDALDRELLRPAAARLRNRKRRSDGEQFSVVSKQRHGTS
jgi:hypothetical protein